MPERGVPEGGFLFAPKSIVDIHFAITGPIAGPLTQPVAYHNAGLV